MSNSWPDGVGRIVLPSVDSTLSEATRLAPTLSGPTWILALKQTAGRGRRGRAWVDPVGNFAATLVMRPGGGPELAALRSFIASLALFDTIVAVTGRATGLALKWPNDVLLNGGKLAGILLESAGENLSIGIGVNLLNTPARADVEPRAVPPVSLVSETGAQVTPEEFLDALAPAFARYETQFTTYGFAPIRSAWLSRAAKLGEVITARTGSAKHTGTFETIDETGALVISTAKGPQSIPAGEVYF